MRLPRCCSDSLIVFLVLRRSARRSTRASRGRAASATAWPRRRSNNGDGFALQAGEGDVEAADANPVDVEQEMMDLADEQLRFLTTAKLLERTYSSLRSAIRGTGA